MLMCIKKWLGTYLFCAMGYQKEVMECWNIKMKLNNCIYNSCIGKYKYIRSNFKTFNNGL